MEKGLETLQTLGRTASEREARANLGYDFDADDISSSRFSPNQRERSRLHQDEEDGFYDSAIGVEDHQLVHGGASGPSRGDYQQASYSTGDTFNPLTSYPSFSLKTGFPSEAVELPQITSAIQSPRLPSFSTAFGTPSTSAHLHHSPYHFSKSSNQLHPSREVD